ncbi:nuclear transport factor 2 family protein [Promicromonospora sp. NPDC090134]|uniref:nuclear transport factor 2 family protein n=1 Tax=Promicromonospora sp. NPDC090134 TaxID=3364408 RepID=UPI003820CDAF
MPWLPEHFSAKYVAELSQRHSAPPAAISFFDGVTSGQVDALIASFAGEPELHHPVRGRIRGRDAFRRYVETTSEQLHAAGFTVEDVDLVVTPHRTVEEVVLWYDVGQRRVGLPVAIVTERSDAGLHELRMYFSTWPITGSHANRPPLLQPDEKATEPDVVGEYQRALAAGDVEATVAAFEPDATVREPAGGQYVHRGTQELRALFTSFFSNGGGIPLEHCTVTDDGRACALEYNVVRWGVTDLPPEAGVAVYVRGASGLLTAARIYDDSNPPLTA